MAATFTPQKLASDLPGSRTLAGGASAMVPGLGQWLLRRPRRAALFFLIWLACLALAVAIVACPTIFPYAPLALLAAGAVMVLAAVDAGKLAARRRLAWDGDSKTYATAAIVAAAGVVLWVLKDTAGSTTHVLFHTLPGYYALAAGLAAAAVYLTAGAVRPAYTRVALGVVIPLLAIWPLDKAAQHTAIWMAHHVTVPVAIRGTSMTPTFAEGELAAVHRRAAIRRFDVIAYRAPIDNGVGVAVKRVVGLPSETVEIAAGEILINGTPVDRPPQLGPITTPDKYGRPVVGGPMHPITLAADEYYVLGDNLDASYDSRYALAIPRPGPIGQHGAVPRDVILGRVTWRIWPGGPWRK